MSMELVTGYTGTQHVSSSQDGARQAGTVGLGQYVLSTGQKLSANMEDANTLVVASGDAMMNGRHVSLPDPTSFTIPTGVQGMQVSNLACIRYERASDSKESVTPVVLTGEPAASDPQDPAYNDGSILDGDSTVDFPLYRVVTTGISAGEPEALFEVVEPVAERPGFKVLWEGSVKPASFPAVLSAPGVGAYQAIVIRAASTNTLCLRALLGETQGSAVRDSQGNQLSYITISEWGEDSLTVSICGYTALSNPALGQNVTRIAGDTATVTGIYGIA